MDKYEIVKICEDWSVNEIEKLMNELEELITRKQETVE